MDSTSKLTNILVNNTDKKIVYVIETEVGTNKIMSKGNDSDSVFFEHNYIMKLPPVGAYNIPDFRVEILNENIYNLTDTTCKQFKGMYSVYINVTDSVFYKNILVKTYPNSTVKDEKYSEKLIIDDTILSILTKDYSMLNKFPEYYKK